MISSLRAAPSHRAPRCCRRSRPSSVDRVMTRCRHRPEQPPPPPIFHLKQNSWKARNPTPPLITPPHPMLPVSAQHKKGTDKEKNTERVPPPSIHASSVLQTNDRRTCMMCRRGADGGTSDEAGAHQLPPRVCPKGEEIGSFAKCKMRFPSCILHLASRVVAGCKFVASRRGSAGLSLVCR
ncbi:hypothetical protein B0T18DRAFT_83926 [Schizothecium vesticola]|uniref:Uncharacterized protein n=1 Tax=Schizothecium vesticola TaxID=314040 RepID=A0AA40F6I9_9PEZI|nr:hypothetical protein B0T18DRAFT_83926 [Schizothecium vesticola]